MRGLLLALALVVVTGTAFAQAPDTQFLIQPGVGIGPVRPGTHITDIIAVAGRPKGDAEGA